MIKRKPLVYVAGEAIELPSGDGLDFPDTGFVHIAEEENITGKKIFEVSPETKNISNPADATSKVPNTRWVQEAIVNAIATGKTKALAFKGIVEANTQLPLTHKQGWVYVVGTPGTYLGKNLEIWDTIVCIKDGESTTRNTAFNEDWWIIQADINGYVLGPGTTTNKNIAIFDGATGKRIKDSGISIDDLIELLESGFIVDSALSATSTNPVQNKVITQALNSKQSLLTFDNTPTEDSINPVTSNGIFEALATKVGTNMLGGTVANGNNKLVTGDAVFDGISSMLGGISQIFVAYHTAVNYDTRPSKFSSTSNATVKDSGHTIQLGFSVGATSGINSFQEIKYYNQTVAISNTNISQGGDGDAAGFTVSMTLPSGGLWLVLGTKSTYTSQSYSGGDDAGTIHYHAGSNDCSWLGALTTIGGFTSTVVNYSNVIPGGTTLTTNGKYGFDVIAFKISTDSYPS